MRWTMIVALFATAGAMLWINVQSTQDGAPAWEFATIESVQEVWIGNAKTTSVNTCYQALDGYRWDTILVSNAGDRSTMPLPQQSRVWASVGGNRSR